MNSSTRWFSHSSYVFFNLYAGPKFAICYLGANSKPRAFEFDIEKIALGIIDNLIDRCINSFSSATSSVPGP
jgi:hypothetical protein